MNIYPEVSYKTNYIDIAFSQPQTQMKDTELIELSILYSFDIKKSSNLLLKWSNCPYCHGLVVQYILPELSDRSSYLPYTLHTDRFLLLSQPSYHIQLAVKKRLTHDQINFIYYITQNFQKNISPILSLSLSIIILHKSILMFIFTYIFVLTN